MTRACEHVCAQRRPALPQGLFGVFVGLAVGSQGPNGSADSEGSSIFMDVPVDLRPLCYVGFVASRLKWIWVGLTRDPHLRSYLFSLHNWEVVKGR